MGCTDLAIETGRPVGKCDGLGEFSLPGFQGEMRFQGRLLARLKVLHKLQGEKILSLFALCVTIEEPTDINILAHRKPIENDGLA